MLNLLSEKLGIKLDRTWRGNDGGVYLLSENGYLYQYHGGNKIKVQDKLSKLLSGELKPHGKPEEGETYWTISLSSKDHPVQNETWTNSSIDGIRYDRKLVFPTKEIAEIIYSEMLNVAKNYQKALI